jgi:hypothetical protein
MFIDLGIQLRLTDEQFVAEMAHRREVLGLDENDHVIGCPLCMAQIPLLPEAEETDGEGASSLEASAAQELLGTWSLPLESEAGRFDLGLEFSTGDAGQLVASVNTSQGNQSVENISRSGEAFVLDFKLEAFGSPLETTIRLTPADTGVLVAQVNVGGFISVSGTATRE